ncbi:glycosyltransferase [Ornithinimicrobium sp. INDO-MA30-4]|uniref:glycosyltransferase n=1 Tax=Ornithinimicrobium sp. INDO-MA30-4 TaxID=2908651 RepID=UPI001F4400F4|nr:glycosyltransferase [Ornithinimicrobium sp. INDO-MA30-4]UJH69910.1 glycosyltransferase family 4 protein [Ornithinimicrobium sp. INDO-MA30-4]
MPANTLRICSITPVLPHAGIQHAGGNYVWRLHLALTEALGAHVTYLVPPYPSNDRALEDPRHAAEFSLVGRIDSHLQTLTYRAFGALKRIDPDTAYLPAALDIWLNRRVRRTVAEADVLDFQWTAWTRLVTLRVLNKDAKTVVTFHDVTSQSFSRRHDAAQSKKEKVRWRVRHHIARIFEHRVVAVADAVVVFSEKDRKLLDPALTKNHIVVVPPPLASGNEPLQSPPSASVVLFLAYFARAENQQGLRWFVDRVWPVVRQSAPATTLRVAGAGMPADLMQHLQNTDGVQVVGFVERLDDAYDSVSLTVVPLLSGAGVKFKTVEPIVRGLPVVSTTVGAEGIGTHDWFAGVADTPREFARYVIEALRDPDSAFEHAKITRGKALQVFGQQAFLDSLRQVYLSPKRLD